MRTIQGLAQATATNLDVALGAVRFSGKPQESWAEGEKRPKDDRIPWISMDFQAIKMHFAPSFPL